LHVQISQRSGTSPMEFHKGGYTLVSPQAKYYEAL